MIDLQVDFAKGNGLVPAIIQDAETKEVLMQGYMNDTALIATQKSGYVHFWSRSRNQLWKKGETSGNTLAVVNVKTDCDNDSLLIRVNPRGAICHTGNYSCFNEQRPVDVTQFRQLYNTIIDRKQSGANNSYTAQLFAEGLEKILSKVEEESGEVLQAARYEGRQRLIEESADLLYHLWVLLAEQDIDLNEIAGELQRRSK